MTSVTRLLSGLLAMAILAAGCGSSDSAAPGALQEPSEATAADTAAAGIRLVSAADGAEIQANPPEGLIVLDVRTPEEFAEGHLEGAMMIDFYRDDFADQLADLDPEVPYLLYCRSGNRSGQAAIIMDGLGFSDVANIDGGILSWTEAGLPTVG